MSPWGLLWVTSKHLGIKDAGPVRSWAVPVPMYLEPSSGLNIEGIAIAKLNSVLL